MLLDSKRLAVEQAWLQQCSARAKLDQVAAECNAASRDYFSQPAALVWPFVAGVLLIRFRRAAPATLEMTSLALSAFKVASKASPLIKRFLT